MIFLKKIGPGIAWFFLVTTLCCLPGSDLPKVGNWFSIIHFDKWVHIGLFGMLAFLFMLPVYQSKIQLSKKNNYFIFIVLVTSIWGLCIEFIQKYWVVGRSFDIFDWVADTVGALLAFVFVLYFIKKIRWFNR